MMRQLMVVATCGLLLAAGEAKEKHPMGDREKIQGTWALVAGERNGKPLPDEAIKHVKIIVSGDKLTTMNKERKFGVGCVEQWLRDPRLALVDDLVLTGSPFAAELFSLERVRAIARQRFSLGSGWSETLWRIINLSVWGDRFAVGV